MYRLDILMSLCSCWNMKQLVRFRVSSGTSKQQCFLPVHTIRQTLTPHILAGLLPFHCITGYNTGTSSDADFFSHMKTEKIFIVKMYSPNSKLTSVASLRAAIFNKVDPESFSPTSDVLHCHVLRCRPIYKSPVLLCYVLHN